MNLLQWIACESTSSSDHPRAHAGTIGEPFASAPLGLSVHLGDHLLWLAGRARSPGRRSARGRALFVLAAGEVAVGRESRMVPIRDVFFREHFTLQGNF